MHGKATIVVRRKTASFFCSFPLCAVFSCFHTTDCEAYSFRTDGYGIFNVRTNLGVGRRGARQKQVCTRVDSEEHKNCCSPCPARGSNPGSSGLKSDSLATELRHPWRQETMNCHLCIIRFALVTNSRKRSRCYHCWDIIGTVRKYPKCSLIWCSKQAGIWKDETILVSRSWTTKRRTQWLYPTYLPVAHIGSSDSRPI